MFSKRLNFLINALLIFLICPFLVLFVFNNPTPEDFSWSETTRSYGYIEAQKFFYNIWSGRYFSYLVLSINPLIFKSIQGYKIYMLLFFLLFICTTFAFISAFTKNILVFRDKLLITLSIIFLYLYAMTSVSEGLYWLTAVLIYNLGIILLMLFIVFYKKAENSKNTVLRTVHILICFFIIVAAAGTSELTSFLTFVLAITFLIRSFILKNNLKGVSILFTIAAVISVLFAFSSPGNYLRSLQFANSHNLTYTLQYSFTYLLNSIFSWIFLSPLPWVTVLLSPLLLKIYKKREENTKWISVNLVYKFLALLCLVYLMVVATVWNTGQSPYGRAVNIAYIIFLLGWFYNASYLIAYLNNKVNINFNNLPRYIYVLIFLFASVFLIKKNNIRIAFSESLRGQAYNYDRKFNERYRTILENNSENIQLESIKNKPKSFFLYDITGDTEHVYNKWYSQFFNKKTLIIKKP